MRNVLIFFVVSCALTALCQTPAILAIRAGEQPTGIDLPLMVIGSSGPTLVAIAMAALLEGRAGLRALFRRGVQTKARLPFALVALFHIFVAHMIASAALWAVRQYTAQQLVYVPMKFEHFAILIIAPLGEEYGWRGYALPRLQQVMSPVTASVVIGVVWALWHVPTFFMPGWSLGMGLALFVPLMIAGSIIYTWLFNSTGGSMFVIVLAHAGAHADSLGRGMAMDGLRPIVGTIVVLVLFAAALVATGRLRRTNAVTHA